MLDVYKRQVAQGGSLRRGMLEHPAVVDLAKRHSVSPIQILLAFVLSHPGVFAIPRTGKPAHAKQNAEAAAIRLSGAELEQLDCAFPPPKHKVYLDIL